MDYSNLAAEFLSNMPALRYARPQKNISEAMHGEAFVLDYIAKQGEEVIPSKIGHEMDVSSARIAQALNSIERKEFITRQIDTNDRRKIIVRLTPKGKAQAERHYREMISQTAQMLELLGEEDAVEFVRLTGKLAKLLAGWNRNRKHGGSEC